MEMDLSPSALSSAAGVGVVAATFFTAIVGEYFPHASNLARFEAKQKAEQIRLKALLGAASSA